MRFSRYVLILARSDYREQEGGLERYLRDEIAQLNQRGISSLCLFPFVTRRSARVNAYLSHYWGAVVDGQLTGFCRADRIPDLLAQEETGGCRLAEVHIHHLLGFHLADVRGVLEASSCAVRLFLHDYYTICPQYTLLMNGEKYCGPAAPSLEKCSRCASWTPEHHVRIANLLEGVRGRLTIVAPSEACRRIWEASFPDYADRIAVVPHWIMVWGPAQEEERELRRFPIRIAFIGAPKKLKGWDVFRGVAREFATVGSGYKFFHLGSVPETLPGVRFLRVSSLRDGPDAMSKAIRKTGIDVVFLWSICPETYSFVLWECLASRAMIVTHSDSGNIADVTESLRAGKVFAGPELLAAYLQDAERVRNDLELFRQRKEGFPVRTLSNDAIVKSIDGTSCPRIADTGSFPIRSAWHIALVYQLKQCKRKWAGRG